MSTEAYLSLFYPFEKLDVVKKGIESSWNINQDRAMLALAMTFAEQPMAMNMQFQRQYAEPYEWIVQQFKDWAQLLVLSRLRPAGRGIKKHLSYGHGCFWRDRTDLSYRPV